MQFSFWGKNLKAGEEHEIGRDGSDVFSNACLAGGKKAEVYVNGMLVCCLSTSNPQCNFSSKAPYDTPTVIRVEKGEVAIVGYSATIEIIEEDEEDMAPCSKKACTGCHQDPKKTEKKNEKKNNSKKIETPAAPVEVTIDMGTSDPYLGQPVHEEVSEEGAVEAEQITIGKKKYFLHRASRMLYSGSLEDAKFAGFYDPVKKAITQTPPDFTIDEDTLMHNSTLAGQKRVEALRAEWDQKYGDDESEVTIDSDEDARFEEEAAFTKKRKLESDKMYTRERGMSCL